MSTTDSALTLAALRNATLVRPAGAVVELFDVPVPDASVNFDQMFDVAQQRGVAPAPCAQLIALTAMRAEMTQALRKLRSGMSSVAHQACAASRKYAAHWWTLHWTCLNRETSVRATDVSAGFRWDGGPRLVGAFVPALGCMAVSYETIMATFACIATAQRAAFLQSTPPDMAEKYASAAVKMADWLRCAVVRQLRPVWWTNAPAIFAGVAWATRATLLAATAARRTTLADEACAMQLIATCYSAACQSIEDEPACAPMHTAWALAAARATCMASCALTGALVEGGHAAAAISFIRLARSQYVSSVLREHYAAFGDDLSKMERFCSDRVLYSVVPKVFSVRFAREREAGREGKRTSPQIFEKDTNQKADDRCKHVRVVVYVRLDADSLIVPNTRESPFKIRAEEPRGAKGVP